MNSTLAAQRARLQEIGAPAIDDVIRHRRAKSHDSPCLHAATTELRFCLFLE
jgi:hypothetical protein